MVDNNELEVIVKGVHRFPSSLFRDTDVTVILQRSSSTFTPLLCSVSSSSQVTTRRRSWNSFFHHPVKQQTCRNQSGLGWSEITHTGRERVWRSSFFFFYPFMSPLERREDPARGMPCRTVLSELTNVVWLQKRGFVWAPVSLWLLGLISLKEGTEREKKVIEVFVTATRGLRDSEAMWLWARWEITENSLILWFDKWILNWIHQVLSGFSPWRVANLKTITAGTLLCYLLLMLMDARVLKAVASDWNFMFKFPKVQHHRKPTTKQTELQMKAS